MLTRIWLIFLFAYGCSTSMRLPTVDEQLAEAEAHRQRVATVRKQVAYDDRLYNIAFSIRRDNAGLCSDVSHESGITSGTIDDIKPEWRPAYRDAFGLTGQVTILNVTPDSPADRAGIAPGEIITHVNGQPLGQGRPATKKLAKSIKQANTLSLTIQRNSESYTTAITPAQVCAYPTVLAQSNEVNAWTDGDSIFVSTGMLRFTNSDHALGLIIGHELAHVTQNHVRKTQANVLIGAVVGALISAATDTDVTEKVAEAGSLVFSQDFEAEADYVGAYYAHRAGYSLTEGVQIWRELATEHPKAIDLEGSTHPSTAKRFLAIENTIGEIEEKVEQGLDVVPTRKE